MKRGEAEHTSTCACCGCLAPIIDKHITVSCYLCGELLRDADGTIAPVDGEAACLECAEYARLSNWEDTDDD